MGRKFASKLTVHTSGTPYSTRILDEQGNIFDGATSLTLYFAAGREACAKIEFYGKRKGDGTFLIDSRKYLLDTNTPFSFTLHKVCTHQKGRHSMIHWSVFEDNTSSAVQGSEREDVFSKNIIESVLSPSFRVGTGDILGANKNKTGQQDIVIETLYPISFSSLNEERLYLADSVAAVVEIKSNIQNKWDDILDKARHVSEITCAPTLRASLRSKAFVPCHDRIPFLVCGYNGWKKRDSFEEKLKDSKIDGIISIDDASAFHFWKNANDRVQVSSGSAALYTFICQVNAIVAARSTSLFNYGSYIS